MPRVYFTGRKKIPQRDVNIVLQPGSPSTFGAEITPERLRKLPPEGKVFVEAYHNTVRQRFDFGTVAHCRPLEDLVLTDFDESDRPRFRVRIVDIDENHGAILAACDSIDAVDADGSAEGGRSLLKLVAKSDAEMCGELWKVVDIGGAFQLWYNRDLPSFGAKITGRDTLTLALILPAALRAILDRQLLRGDPEIPDQSDWVRFGQLICHDALPQEDGSKQQLMDDLEAWIDRVIASFCINRGKFVALLLAQEDSAS